MDWCFDVVSHYHISQERGQKKSSEKDIQMGYCRSRITDRIALHSPSNRIWDFPIVSKAKHGLNSGALNEHLMPGC